MRVISPSREVVCGTGLRGHVADLPMLPRDRPSAGDSLPPRGPRALVFRASPASASSRNSFRQHLDGCLTQRPGTRLVRPATSVSARSRGGRDVPPHVRARQWGLLGGRPLEPH